jgi:hypothetical protein
MLTRRPYRKPPPFPDVQVIGSLIVLGLKPVVKARNSDRHRADCRFKSKRKDKECGGEIGQIRRFGNQCPGFVSRLQ